MYRNIIGLSMILLSSSINFLGQLLFRRLSKDLFNPEISRDARLPIHLLFVKVLIPPSKEFIAGAFLLFTGLSIWVVALGFIRFSIGFPIYLSLSISFSVLYAAIISREGMGSCQYLGLGLLILAIVLLVRK